MNARTRNAISITAAACVVITLTWGLWGQFLYGFGAIGFWVAELALSIGAALAAAAITGAPRRPVLIQAVAFVVARRLYPWWVDRFHWLPWRVAANLPTLIGAAAGVAATLALKDEDEPAPSVGAPIPPADAVPISVNVPTIPAGPGPPPATPEGLLFIRSVAEEHLYMELHPCACGETAFEQKHGLYSVGDDMASRFAGPCKKCGAPRRFDFRALDLGQHQKSGLFGGAEPSRIIDAGQWLAVADRHAKAVPASPSPADKPRALAIMKRALAAEEEVLKFVPPGADAVPDSAFWTPDGRAFRAKEPGRFHKLRLEAVVDVYRKAVAELGGE